MAPHTSVSVPGMITAQGTFQTALDEMNTTYNDMLSEATTLAANWTGETSSAFGQALQTWLDDLNQVKGQLIVVMESLATHTSIYVNTNEGSNQVAQAFTQGLAGLQSLHA